MRGGHKKGLGTSCQHVCQSHGHVDIVNKEALQQIIKEEGKKIIPPAQVRTSVGQEQMKWKLAAEAELTKNFKNMGGKFGFCCF